MNSTISTLLADHPALAVRDHPRLRTTLWRLARAGELESPFPGIVVRAGDDRAITRLVAASLWTAPHGVIHAQTAAHVWLNEPIGPVIELAHPTRRSRPGALVTRHLVSPEFVIASRGLRLATPTYVATQLAGDDHGRLLSEFLRTGLADQGHAQRALESFARSPGQVQRRRQLRDCEQNPWSLAEVRLHSLLHEANITGWRANATIRLDGQVFHPDVLFEAEHLVLEFDGRASHQSADQFLRDRERQNLLVLAGYRVLRFTWEHLDEPDYVIESVQQARNALRWRGSRPA